MQKVFLIKESSRRFPRKVWLRQGLNCVFVGFDRILDYRLCQERYAQKHFVAKDFFHKIIGVLIERQKIVFGLENKVGKSNYLVAACGVEIIGYASFILIAENSDDGRKQLFLVFKIIVNKPDLFAR